RSGRDRIESRSECALWYGMMPLAASTHPMRREGRHATASADGTRLVYRSSWPDARPPDDHQTASRLRLPARLLNRSSPIWRGNLAPTSDSQVSFSTSILNE